MASPILVTKLFIPTTRPELVARPHLIKQLDEGLHRKLTLISAPAGFGKTTLVTEWVKHLRLDDANPIVNLVGWLSLDEGDNDLTRFLTYFTAVFNQIESIDAPFGKEALALLQSPQPPPPRTILSLLINEIAAIRDKIIMVLDDFHLIDTESIHDALAFLFENMPPQMHLVIATREDPHLPLARLRARGQVTELRAADLRFSAAEAAEFLNQIMGLNLSTADIAALEARTEGWIAGLQLAAVSMQGRNDSSGFIRAFTGSNRLVLDYLIEEVLNQQSEEVQAFLLKTAVLTQLTAPLCNAITGQNNSQSILELLERSNLFIIALDDERQWYRYHHLFADLLHQRLQQTQADQLPILHAKASRWFEQNQLKDEAIEHALAAQDFDHTVALLEGEVDAIWGRDEHTKLRRWLEKLPIKWIDANPHLGIIYAWSLFSTGQQDTAERRLNAAEEALGVTVDEYANSLEMGIETDIDCDKVNYLGRIAVTRTFLAFFKEDVPSMIKYSHLALDILPHQDVTWRSTAAISLGDTYSFLGQADSAYQARLETVKMCETAGNLYTLIIANIKLAVTLRQLGNLRQTIEICRQQIKLANESHMSQTITVGCLFAIWGETLAELNEMDQALELVQKGAELTLRGGDVAMLSWSHLCLMRVLLSAGDLDAAENAIRKVNKIEQALDLPPWFMNQMAAWQVRIYLKRGEVETAVSYITKRNLPLGNELSFQHELEYMEFARVLIAQRKFKEANALLQQLLESAEAGGRIAKIIQIHILQALAFDAGGDVDTAVTKLKLALETAQPRGFIRIFVDEGPPMAQLLYESLSRGITTDYIQQLLAVFPDVEPNQTASTSKNLPESEKVEPLSKREVEVLQLIAEGLTNREIGNQLFLTLNTVKAHTRTIYGKLGVNSRTQAVAKARTWGIIR